MIPDEMSKSTITKNPKYKARDDVRIDSYFLVISTILFFHQDVQHRALEAFDGRDAFRKTPVHGDGWFVIASIFNTLRSLFQFGRARTV